ncbi:MAG TPA: gliding motility lipoprotein GldB [Cytophagales bacterium]|jgi:hypothetical protein|nr:gliding motility lipoprotein GldB [Cytophagales bacterium]
MNRALLLFVCAAILFSCDEDKEQKCQYAEGMEMTVDFKSLEDSIQLIQTKKQLVDFFSRHVALRDIFFARRSYPSDSAFVNILFKKFSHPAFDTLLMETKKVFGDGSNLKEEFRLAFANMKYYYPGFQPPRVETVITGLESDLFVSDTLIIVGLDYYLGKNAKYRPNMYEYIVRKYEKNFIVPSAMLLYGIDPKYNHVDMNDHTVLADMISYGKAYYFAKHMIPCFPDSVFIGYSQKEIDGAYANKDVIWKKLIDDEALFSTSNQMKQRYVSERPHVPEIGNECPGRIALWVGWQIVKEYASQHSQTPLPDLMKIKDSQKILRESKYSTLVSQ